MQVSAVPVVPFDTAAAKPYGLIRVATKDRIEDLMDELIAAHAASLSVTVVTNNVDDFRAYPGIKIEN